MLYGIVVVLLIFQLYYLLFVYSRLARYRPVREKSVSTPPVSVVISAYNEEENLRNFLPLILEQDYPTFEVVVVNDCSDDDTTWLLKALQEKYARLRIIEIQEHIRLKHTKKFTLTMGIKGAKYEHLVFTDADCKPSSDQWLKGIVSGFDEQKEIVLGYSPYFKLPGFLNRLIRFETTHTAMSYLSYALMKNAYMGVGRNLAYTRSLFYQGKGFNAHMHLKSGDDDLFVNHNATRRNVAIAIHPDEHVYSNPKETWKSYYRQKARHSGASVLYKAKHQRMLATQLVTAILLYVMLFLSVCIYPSWWYIGLGAYLLRLMTQFIVYRPIFKKLEVADLLLWLPILDIAFYFFICFNGLFNRNKKQTSWK